MDFARTRARAPRLDVIGSTGSTNADLVAAVRAGGDVPHLGVLLTRDQRAGRGRMNRQWATPPGSALAVSVLVRVPDLDAGARGWVPLAAGAAMADALGAQLPQRTVGVKWPNDVLVDGRKICGILAEGTSDPDAIVIGSGVNTAMTEPPVPTATSFALLDAECDEDRLVAAYLDGLDRLLRELAAGGDGPRREVTERCLTLGREVEVSLPDDTVLHGRASRLDPDGRLVVATAGGDIPVAAGDVVHVRGGGAGLV